MGFCRLQLDFRVDPAKLAETTFELDSENNFNSPTAIDLFTLEGFCFVVRIPQFLLTHAGPAVQITVRGANTADLQIDRVYISQAADSVDASRDPFDPLEEDLTAVVDDGVGVFVPQGESVRLPITDYHLDQDKDLLIAFDISATPGLGNLRQIDFAGLAAPLMYYQGRAAPTDPPIRQAALADRTGLVPSVAPGRVAFNTIEKVQVIFPPELTSGKIASRKACMANNLTGDFEAVVQVSVRQINGMLATLHQNGASNDAPLKLLHSVAARLVTCARDRLRSLTSATGRSRIRGRASPGE